MEEEVGRIADGDRAGGLRPEPQASQPEALIPCAWQPPSCVTCNGPPEDIIDITELTDTTRRWCCAWCDAVWIQEPGSEMVQILAEGGS